MSRFLDSALVICEALVEESARDVAAIGKGVWYQSESVAAQRCMASQIAVLQTAKRDAAYLDLLDTVITLAGVVQENVSNAAPMIISGLLGRAYDLLAEELERKAKARKKKAVAKLAA